MARAIWTGSIGFGLVSIPVRLHPATSPKDVRFHEVDRRSGRRVRRRAVVGEDPSSLATDAAWASAPSEEPAPSVAARDEPAAPPPEAPEERTVPRVEVVKAFEVEPGHMVEIDREEIEAVRSEPTRIIEIEHFVELDEIDPVYFEKSYHLAPADEVAHRPYALLRVAMERSGRVGIGRFVLRTKEHLVAVRPTEGILGLETLYFADEVNQPASSWISAQRRDLPEREVDLSVALIDALAADWRPSEYEDRDRMRLMEAIGRKVPRDAVPDEDDRGGDAGPAVPDLMDALRASVDAARGGRDPSRPRSRRRRA